MIAKLKSPGFLIWLVLALALSWISREQIVSGSGWDPDDQLRFVQLRDFLAGQSWFDTTQYRLNVPDGAPMHWSRLIELPLALVVLPLAPLIGQHGAEIAAGILVPLLCLGIIAFILGRIATQIGGHFAGIFAIILTVLSPALVLQLRPMRIDHHGWQIVCAALAYWALFWPNGRKAGIVTGLALAVWLHLSLEGGPAAIIFFAILGWRWAIGGEQGQRLFWTALTFLIGSLLLFFGTQASGFSAPKYCDTISPAHVWSIIGAATIMIPATYFLPARPVARIAAASTAAVVAGTVFLTIVPQCAKGAFATMDPVVRDYWYRSVNEGLPMWHQEPGVIALFIGSSLVGLVSLGFLQSGRVRQWRGELAALLFYSFFLSLLVFRTVSFASVLAVPVVAVGIAALLERYRAEAIAARRILYVAGMIFMLLPGHFAMQLINAAVPSKKAEVSKTSSTEKGCGPLKSIATVAELRDANIVAPFDIGPAILMTSPNKVLASSHHRNQLGMRDHIDIYRLPPAQSRKIVEHRKITHILACPSEAEMKTYEARNPSGLWGQLAKGKNPEWLRPVPSKAEGILIWEVVR